MTGEARAILDGFRRRPSMYIFGVSFGSVTAFLTGLCLGSDPNLLDEFRRWLLIRTGGTGSNLTWEALVLRIAFPDVVQPHRELTSPTQDEAAVASVFDLLSEFLDTSVAR